MYSTNIYRYASVLQYRKIPIVSNRFFCIPLLYATCTTCGLRYASKPNFEGHQSSHFEVKTWFLLFQLDKIFYLSILKSNIIKSILFFPIAFCPLTCKCRSQYPMMGNMQRKRRAATRKKICFKTMSEDQKKNLFASTK